MQTLTIVHAEVSTAEGGSEWMKDMRSNTMSKKLAKVAKQAPPLASFHWYALTKDMLNQMESHELRIKSRPTYSNQKAFGNDEIQASDALNPIFIK